MSALNGNDVPLGLEKGDETLRDLKPKKWRRKPWRISICAMLALQLVSPADMSIAATDAYDVRILRDDYGVPHVYASDLGALFFGFGHAVAEDRLFQLEMTRRTSWGTVAQVLGPEFVELDANQRRVGYTREQVRENLADLESEYRTMMKAYADGVNSVISSIEAGDSELPNAFDQAGFRPSRWTDEDVAQLFIAFMGTRYSDGAGVIETRDAVWLEEWTEMFGAEKAQIMFEDFIQKEADPQLITTVPRETDWRKSALPAEPGMAGKSNTQLKFSDRVSGIVPPGVANVAAFLEDAKATQAIGLEHLGVPRKLGSYGWLIGAERTLNNSAILLGGPQMGHFSPGYLHEIGLHGAGFDVVGSTPIGHLPVLFGHNSEIAWSATAGFGDTVDVFVEELKPDDPTRYKFKGKWRKFNVRQEVIEVKGASPVKGTFYRSVHGPIEYMDVKNGVAYARARGFANLELESMAGWIDSNRAETWESFVAASRRNALSITWLYADNEGNIGFSFCGRYPIRHPRQDRRLPTPGNGDREWSGFVAPEDVPHVLNPERGTIINWNNLPAAGWHTPGIFVGRAHRSEQIIDFFESRPVITVADVRESVRYGAFVDSSAPYFRQPLLNAVEQEVGNDIELERAAEYIAEWDGMWSDEDGDENWDQPGLALFDTWYKHLTFDVFSEERVGSISNLLQYRQKGSSFGLPYAGNLLLNILEGKNSPVLLQGDYLGGSSAESVMVSAFEKAIEELRVKHGPDHRKWLLPIDMAKFNTNNFRGVPQGYEEFPEFLPMRRASENHLVVLSPVGIRGANVVPPGQSGIPPESGAPSPHFADQVDLFLNFDYKPMRFTESEVKGNAKSTKYLSYTPVAHP